MKTDAKKTDAKTVAKTAAKKTAAKKTDAKPSTVLALVDAKGAIKEVIAEGKEQIADALAQRAAPKYGADASHVTNTTRKFQCNADLRYAKAVAKLRKEHDLGTDGATIRMLLEAGLKAQGFKELVAEVEAERDPKEA